MEYVTLPMDIYGEILDVKCATWEDIERFRQKEPLEDFRGSVLRGPLNPKGGKKK
ncbi:hypothetical protein [Flavobacterium sp.]|uniref:hypothetical protein n=1 Tax=Flavobacterium sp. TaxID=239 RepID=UPI004034B567